MKKIFNKIYTVLGVMALVFIAESCLKDDRFVDFSKVGMIVEFPDAVPGRANAISFADPAADGPDTIMVRINQTGPNATTKDITVQFGFSQAGLDMYNIDQSHVVGTALPADAYSFPASVTIKAGKDALNNNNRSASFMLFIYPNKVPITPGVNYVLSLGITSVSEGATASGNFGAILFNFYHNPYDGDYHSTGTRYNFAQASDYAGWDGANNTATGTILSAPPWDFPSTAVLTVNATTSTLHAGNQNGAFGTINIEVDPATNEVTIISTADTGLNALVPLVGPGAPPSTWNPATKTLDLYYQYTNTSGTFRVIHDKLVHN